MANQSGFPVWGPDKTHLWLKITPSILDLKQKSKWQTSFKSWDLSKNALKPANFQFTCPLDFFQHKWRQTVRLLLHVLFHSKHSKSLKTKPNRSMAKTRKKIIRGNSTTDNNTTMSQDVRSGVDQSNILAGRRTRSGGSGENNDLYAVLPWLSPLTRPLSHPPYL